MSKTTRNLLVAIPIASLTLLTATAPATATPAPFLRVDKTTVSPGMVVHVSAYCGRREGLNHVGSAAFAPTGHDGPYQGNGGVVVFTERTPGGGEGYAEIRADAVPGTYYVGQRCGGGNAGGLTLTVTP
ncbi:hypothetical protein [Amycolatopsis cihanbeyliensis]|uniref:Secreted protein n=1 Tax=Amycolatopsis cihanbeyliensis TaxID=1128664 RepID=A0A542DJ48_AMYCI|nr:hypothetical protein [Amycolatopsis cihanbeyliensis]TQJ03122.1 hypothetical protein FB471_2872 [Amycolatopsis cihanbeyliensis]